jgi:hypothetical protein
MTTRLAGTLGWLGVVAALSALPAHGEGALSPQILYTLTSSDTVPTKQDLQSVLASPDNELTLLRQYSLGTSFDFGMRLRAIRAMPHFCTGQMAECRSAILAALDEHAGTPGQQILRKRAAIEALGAARTGDAEDGPLLVGYLAHDSRDLRVAAVRALRDLCDPAAIGPLQQRRLLPTEVGQVKQAIDEALGALAQCGP